MTYLNADVLLQLELATAEPVQHSRRRGHFGLRSEPRVHDGRIHRLSPGRFNDVSLMDNLCNVFSISKVDYSLSLLTSLSEKSVDG